MNITPTSSGEISDNPPAFNRRIFFWAIVSALAGFLAESLAPQYDEPESADKDLAAESATSVLDALLDSVESATAGGKSGT